MAYRITIIKGDNHIHFEKAYATKTEAHRAILSIEVIEVLVMLDYDYSTVTEVEG